MADLLAPPDPAGAVAWLLTYALHGTLLLLAAGLVARHRRLSVRWRERLWKGALLGGLLTASGQTALDVRPVAGSLRLPPVARAAAPSSDGAASVARRSLLGGELDSGGDARVGGREAAGARAAVPLESGGAPAGSAAREISGNGPRSLWLAAAASTTANDGGGDERATPAGGAGRPGSAGAGAELAADRTRAWTLAALAVWLLGALAGLVGWAVAWGRLGRELAGRQPLPGGPLAEVAQRLRRRAGLRRRVGLCVAPRLRVPVTFGVARPTIALPTRVVRELEPAAQEAILAHEMAHVARWDPAWLILCGLLERVLFFQPLLRVARRELQELSELACDDWALATTGARVPLARGLADVAASLAATPPGLPVPGMAHAGTQLSTRVRRILDGGHRPPRDLGRPLSGAVAGALGVATVALLPGVTARAATETGPARVASPVTAPERAADRPTETDSERAASRGPGSGVRPAPAPRGGGPDAAGRGGPLESLDSLGPGQRSPADAVPTRAGAAVAGAAVAALGVELEALEGELRALRAEIGARGLGGRHGDELERLAAQLERIHAGRARLAALLPELPASADADHPRVPTGRAQDDSHRR